MAAHNTLPIEFNILPNPQPDEQGRTTYQVRQDTHGALNTRGLIEHMRRHNKLTQYPVDNIIRTLTEEIVEQLFLNRCMHIDGLGTFSLNIALKPVIDEQGVAHKRTVTDPTEITGNDIEVTGINFRPDKEFLSLATTRPTYFKHSEARGTVGHSKQYTRQQMVNSLLSYLDSHDSLSRGTFTMEWKLTRYQAQKWLTELTSGTNPPLIESRPANAYIYTRNPEYAPET